LNRKNSFNDVRYTINAVIDEIVKFVELQIDEIIKMKNTPHQSPLPKGRGDMEPQ